MGYAPILFAVLCFIAAAVVTVGILWLARHARRIDAGELAPHRRNPRRASASEDAETREDSRVDDVTLVVRFERAGESAMREVVGRYAPNGELPPDQLGEALESMVDALRLATHAEGFVARGEAKDLEGVRSPLGGGLLAALRVRSDGPLPRLEDPSHLRSLADFLRGLRTLEPAAFRSVRLFEARSDEGADLELRPLHR